MLYIFYQQEWTGHHLLVLTMSKLDKEPSMITINFYQRKSFSHQWVG